MDIFYSPRQSAGASLYNKTNKNPQIDLTLLYNTKVFGCHRKTNIINRK